VCTADDDIQEVSDLEVFAYSVSVSDKLINFQAYHTSPWHDREAAQDHKYGYAFGEPGPRANQLNRV